ncbi:hypothetical protein BDK51DRAFT_31103 [Blyttiomyces helicus]|uniref:CBS domain-containing protein n=1 Tax=Blyttiomyces helicus TaxID=388810 RepID=A0A4P9WH40_9FUNG|nr:hypothetical protein BDK51DRAFT_31103 [Blyttiomyces helicus]|eukprot:RKO91255.1 hypothetical protein BDK51DRAFT_31103 [Blyttiomyces helicus]
MASTNEEKYRGASVEDLQLPEAISIIETQTVAEALELMALNEFSQAPVVSSKRRVKGLVTYAKLQADRSSGALTDLGEPVSKWMHRFANKGSQYQVITPATPLAELEHFFETHPAAFVTDEGGRFPLAVVTKEDLAQFLTKRGG